MADAIENAAVAFDVDMGRGKSAPASRSSEPSAAPVEEMFPNLGEKIPGTENDEAGGDKEPDPKPKKKQEDAPEDDEDADEGEDAPEDDEDADEGEDAPEDDEDADEGDDPELDKEFTVMVDGQEKNVKLREALNGYIRTETFHQRLNQVDEVAKAVQTEGQQIIVDRQKLVGQLEEAEALLKEMVPEEPDWETEYAKNPQAAAAMQKAYKGIVAKLAEVRTKREAAQAEAANKAMEDTQKFMRAEFPKFANAAKWRDKEEMEKDLKAMRRTAKDAGFSDQEIGAVYDSRMLVLLRKASKYDRMMAARPKPVRNGGSRQVNPGAGTTRGTAHKGLTAAQAQLTKTGSVEAAANVFEQMLKPNRRR